MFLSDDRYEDKVGHEISCFSYRWDFDVEHTKFIAENN